jgi:hypothetical protein
LAEYGFRNGTIVPVELLAPELPAPFCVLHATINEAEHTNAAKRVFHSTVMILKDA